MEVSVDQFFFPNAEVDKSTQRRQLDTMLDEMGSKELTIMTTTARGIQEAGKRDGNHQEECVQPALCSR